MLNFLDLGNGFDLDADYAAALLLFCGIIRVHVGRVSEWEIRIPIAALLKRQMFVQFLKGMKQVQTNDRNVDRFGRVLRIDKRDRIADADAATLFIVQTKLDRFGSVCDHGKRLRMQVHYMMHSLTGLGMNPREFRKEKPDAIASGLLARLAGFEPATYRFVAGHSIH